MFRVSALLLAATLFGAADNPKKAATTDEALEGTWNATSFIDHGQGPPDMAKFKCVLTLKGGRYTMTINGAKVDEGTYTADPTSTPKHLDTTPSGGPQKGIVDHGIYELKGNTLKTSFDEAGKKDRPTGFDVRKYQVVEFARAG